MKVTVFGGATEIGRQVVADLLLRGHEVIAYLPDRDQVPADLDDGVQIIRGELTGPKAIEAAVAAGEAVVNALDPRTTPLDRSPIPLTLSAHIVGAMHRHGLRRYIGYTSPAIILCPHERAPAWIRAHRLYARWFRPRRQEQLSHTVRAVTASGLDWTLVRFLQVRPGNPRGWKYVGYFGQHPVRTSATVADIARFTAAQVLDTDHLHAAPAVSN